MRFMISVIDSKTRSQHSAAEIQAIDDFNEKLENAGQRILACGLDSPSGAAVFDSRDGSNQVSEGPFVSSDEFFSGFWVIEAGSEEAARALAAEGSKACNRKVELRALLG